MHDACESKKFVGFLAYASFFIVPLDPSINVHVEWPAGKYSLIEAATGCPQGFSTRGCRKQDSEDDDNINSFSDQIGEYLKRGEFGRNIEICYCSKTSTAPTTMTWPRGRYCIARYVDTVYILYFLHVPIKLHIYHKKLSLFYSMATS